MEHHVQSLPWIPGSLLLPALLCLLSFGLLLFFSISLLFEGRAENTMTGLRLLQPSFAALAVTVSLALNALAGIGPVLDLTISNANVSPDGFQRAAVVANDQAPGPLITGQMGDRFQINVVNKLSNHTMLKSTSIVCAPFRCGGTVGCADASTR